MSFEKVGNWEEFGNPLVRENRVLVAPNWLDRKMAEGWDWRAKRGGATIITLLVHALLLWLFVTRLSSEVEVSQSAQRGNGTTFFELSGNQAIDEEEAARFAELTDPVETKRPSEPSSSQLDLSAPSDFRPEWTVSRMSVEPQTQSEPIVAPQAANPGTAPTGAGTGQGTAGGGQGYDPYAGASPLRREDQAVRSNGVRQPQGFGDTARGLLGLGPSTENGLNLIRQEYEAARISAQRIAPGAHGSVEIEVQVSATGTVQDTKIVRLTGDPRAAAALRSALLGRKMFDVQGLVSVLTSVTLPQMSL
jgi:hypothetical protein